jgi:putative oligomerization/nucleic acid binding protein
MLRAAAVGGAAYYAGKRRAENEAQNETDAYDQGYGEAQAANEGLTEGDIQQLKELSQLKEQGVLTEDEFETQKQKILGG